MGKPLVYSYTRFSDPRQSTGHSAERQSEYAARWAAEHDLVLDHKLSLKDEGLSAYHQKHVKQGALGVFLLAVDEGRIPPGSVLIVEGLDRLSRAEPIQAQAQLAQIINAGITVVTASDGREYNRAGLKAQPMDLVYSLLVMIRAHEESDTKSKRVTAAIRRQCAAWVAGTNRSIIRNGKDPAWMTWNGEAWELIPSRVEAILTAIELYKKGHGAIKIVRELSTRGMSITDLGVQAQQIYRTVKLRALIGEKVISVGGEEFRIPGYYPPIMSPEDFADLQVSVGTRFVRKGKGEIPSFVTGMGITYCGYCGTTVNTTNSPPKTNKKGHQLQGHRRILCVGYGHNDGCKVGGSCSVVPIEDAIMDFCSDQLKLTSLVSGGDRSAPVIARLNAARQRVAETERQIDRITAVMLSDDGAAPLAFTRKARELEEGLIKEKAALEQAENELSSISVNPTPAVAEAWIEAKDGARAMDYDARMKVRMLMIETFSRLVIYQRGFEPTPDAMDDIDLLLIAKSGNTRSLRINRTTGAWKASEDYSVPEGTIMQPAVAASHA